MSYLTPKARAAVLAELGFTTPADAATWMDDIRVSPDYDYMKGWHFINIEKGQQYRPSKDNIIAALEKAYKELTQGQGIDDLKRRTDLKILFHLIADLHQPLHTGYEADRGGNEIRLNFEGNMTNLHHVWDNGIIESQRITAASCRAVATSFTEDISKSPFSPAEFLDYMTVTRNLLPNVYALSNGKIGPDYARKNKRIVETQLYYAGVRLAKVLNQIYDNKTDKPAGGTASDKQPRSFTAAEASSHLGQTVTICGHVSDTKRITSKRVTYINLGAAASTSSFAIVIQDKDRGAFMAPPENIYKSLDVCVSGLVRTYDGRPAIVATDEEQIELQ
jgi:hypothetical protein